MACRIKSHRGNGGISLYDPIKRAEDTARIACRGNRRRYYRFRPARFYGGIGTADCLGCCLSCLFCWSWDKVVRPDRFGTWYSPHRVAGKLTLQQEDQVFILHFSILLCQEWVTPSCLAVDKDEKMNLPQFCLTSKFEFERI